MLAKEQWVARKSEWPDIGQRLSFSKRHTKRELKMFEDYFVRHKNPPLDYGRDPIPLVYRLWLSPDQSEAGWRDALEHVLRLPPVMQENSLTESRRILFEEAMSTRYNGLGDAPLGFLGGMEERLASFFMSEQDGGGGRLLHNIAWNFGCYNDLRFWLLSLGPHNPYVLERYMVDLWLEKLADEEYLKFCTGDTPLKFCIKKYLGAVKSLLSQVDDGSGRVPYAKKIAAALDGVELHAPIAKWWADA